MKEAKRGFDFNWSVHDEKRYEEYTIFFRNRPGILSLGTRSGKNNVRCAGVRLRAIPLMRIP